MEKNNQPLILGAIAIGAVLIIALALVFIRNDKEAEILTESTVSESEGNGTEENGNGDDSEEVIFLSSTTFGDINITNVYVAVKDSLDDSDLNAIWREVEESHKKEGYSGVSLTVYEFRKDANPGNFSGVGDYAQDRPVQQFFSDNWNTDWNDTLEASKN